MVDKGLRKYTDVVGKIVGKSKPQKVRFLWLVEDVKLGSSLCEGP